MSFLRLNTSGPSPVASTTGMISITTINRVENPKLNLYCFHWAGGSGSAYRPLAKELASFGVNVLAVNLPGRNGRGTDKMFRSIGNITEAIYHEIEKFHAENKLGVHPTFFFGHSLGGLISFELTKMIEQKMAENAPEDSANALRVAKVIASAVRSPADLTQHNKEEVPRHTLSDEDLMEYIEKMGGIPAGVDPDIIKMMLPTIKGDYLPFEKYDVGDFGGVLEKLTISCPLTVFVATEDVVQPKNVVDWKTHTTADFQLVEFQSSSHFYLIDEEHKDKFKEKLVHELLG
mmetsp:Transcript_22335/g.37365  ORF Transcript_22335/g.37365 Transcript_22335/m.37365 type:complete len:290 (+) Transcript_22335:119-988(+)